MNPGESVRNFYRNQGIKAERERIEKLVWALLMETRKERDTTDNPVRENRLAGNCLALEDVLSLIEGDN